MRWGIFISNYDSTLYDENYYRSHCGTPYDRHYNDGMWLKFFQTIAEQVVKEYRPSRFLDVGCAKGFLVETLRDLGVEASGFDVSTSALLDVRQDVKLYCNEFSSDDPNAYDGKYDVISCIEVLEHLPPDMGENTIRLLCEHSDIVIFSSSPDDFTEVTHINVKPLLYWSSLFSKYGFEISTLHNWAAQYIAPHAVIFKRKWIIRMEMQENNIKTLMNQLLLENRAQMQNQVLVLFEALRIALGTELKTILNDLGDKSHEIKVSLVELGHEKKSIELALAQLNELISKQIGDS